MSDIKQLLCKRREERTAREKARIEKLREMNLKKYGKIEAPRTSISKLPKSTSEVQIRNAALKTVISHNATIKLKCNDQVNTTTKRPITASTSVKNVPQNHTKSKVVPKTGNKLNNEELIPFDNNATPNTIVSNNESKIPISKPVDTKNMNASILKNGGAKSNKLPVAKTETQKVSVGRVSLTTNLPQKKVLTEITKEVTIRTTNISRRKTFGEPSKSTTIFAKPKTTVSRKPIMPTLQENTKPESVFERLYKPKYLPKTTVNVVEKLKTDPNFLEKAIKKTGLILNKRHTLFDTKTTQNVPRRSLSAVHLKRISKSEAANCMHKWASIGDINDPDVELNEDDKVKGDKVTSAIKSERKKVTFMTPIPSINTPRPEELQARLKAWLQKRGKSLDSYHHLQCFGVHLKTGFGTPKRHNFNETLTNENANSKAIFSSFNEENKENIALESDSDDGSYTELMNGPKEALSAGDKIDIYNWRRASIDSESVGFNESTNFNDTNVTSAETLANVDELLIGALNDLCTLLREGFDWQQSARWLRTIRERFPHAPQTAAYWECRAALEDSRGDLPASVQCWEEAIAKGTEHSVVEANLDQLLDKFMQLKISPKSGAQRLPDSKLVDVKNVFKSTIIRFAVQQAKLRRQSEQALTPVYTVTPVRRSGRLSHCATRTPRPESMCDSVRQVVTIAPQHIFTPNKNLVATP